MLTCHSTKLGDTEDTEKKGEFQEQLRKLALLCLQCLILFNQMRARGVILGVEVEIRQPKINKRLLQGGARQS